MKTTIALAIMMIGINIGMGQNLVPNCSFEDTVNCPGGALGNISGCLFWYSAGTDQSSPDYYKSCGSYPNVPYNPNGYQNASTGNSYTGIIPWIPCCVDEKEYIGTKLTSPLEIGKSYYISFKVSATYNIIVGYVTNKIGILLSTKKYDNLNPISTTNFSHLFSNTIINDSTNWTKIYGWVTADSSYEYITIGNFFSDFQTDTIRMHVNEGFFDEVSYYYIDDVCVSLDSSNCLCDSMTFFDERLQGSEIIRYQNPASTILPIWIKRDVNRSPFLLIIYNISGKNVIKQHLHNGINEINISELNNGIYIINIITNNELYNNKLIINNQAEY